jgi:succinoglycan biosynthesis protein ExoM
LLDYLNQKSELFLYWIALKTDNEKVNISICICTRRRKEGLRRLLDSLVKLKTPSDSNVRIIIVENDLENFSESIINDYLIKSSCKISYCLEPRLGIVFARNRSVKEAGECDFCCFTDDDQIVSSDWLLELLKCQKEFNADGVAGPTKPYFIKEIPVYIRNYHQPDIYPYGTKVNSAFTGCLLLRKKYLDMVDGPFDIRFNFTGGEDSYLTMKITNLGGIIRFNPDAVAHEIIPEERSTIRFIIKRTFRISNIGLLVKSLGNEKNSKINIVLKLVFRFFYGSLIIIPYLIFSKTNRLKGLIKIINAIGGFTFIFGKHSQFYKKTESF